MKTSADSPVVLDTNVLVYAVDTDAPQHEAAKRVCAAAAAGEFPAFITTQVVLEYVSVVTSPKRVTAPMTLAEAWEDVRQFLAAFTLLSLHAEDVPKVASLSEELELGGPRVFDLGIAVSALNADVDTVCTYDSSVFARVPGLKVVQP
jgi:toxin-antitoxin system PIN domain toxin